MNYAAVWKDIGIFSVIVALFEAVLPYFGVNYDIVPLQLEYVILGYALGSFVLAWMKS